MEKREQLGGMFFLACEIMWVEYLVSDYPFPDRNMSIYSGHGESKGRDLYKIGKNN